MSSWNAGNMHMTVTLITLYPFNVDKFLFLVRRVVDIAINASPLSFPLLLLQILCSEGSTGDNIARWFRHRLFFKCQFTRIKLIVLEKGHPF